MSFDLQELQAAVKAHDRVARVVVADVRGSTPREVGAAMLVWEGGQSGTIGGGQLEFEAAEKALHQEGLSRHALGPDLGQCCGGAVTLLTEVFEAEHLSDLEGQAVIARGPGDKPLAVQRIIDRGRARGERPAAQLIGEWFVEPVSQPSRDIWIWGAGHVGRALVSVLCPLSDITLTWVDTSAERFPDDVPENVRVLPAAHPQRLAVHAPANAEHLILTYSHEIDFALCHALLGHGFGFCGLIGSDTKWVRFRKRLSALGHSEAQISRICCPIGQKGLGKHPQAIAIGVAARLLEKQMGDKSEWPIHSYPSVV
ncbi:xanthine dehydrogenase accessory protein XdhC [Thalassococcus lentus]|uniref:Xanthine dehydrogenase accessory protein XdhC n=1 Tax=Thalassococcus lentus TaxID=1210524 RepID=A0ABT4XTI4_9RHOB|nr:xanthine dehydrogenase accessory protein XdhC [Thalassococcus lentus]MDA7425210.1 xanthine dehydrogenase accessory protein XdhC [Thalassococcus lentus]